MSSIANAATSFLGGLVKRKGDSAAAGQQLSAISGAKEVLGKSFAPYTQAGESAINRLAAGIAPGGEFATQFTMADATNSAAMRESERAGLEAINNSAAAKGGLLNSNAVQDATKFAEANAAQYQQQAFNQWLQQRQANLQPVEYASTLGGGMATNYGSDIADLTLKGGDVQAQHEVDKAQNTANLLSDANKIGQGIWGMFSSSDERLKENIKEVGVTHDGVPIYTYRFKDGGPTKMGVMAQDMARHDPKAVARGPGGYLMVDYSRV